MKSLVIVALLSMFSYANASVDLSCVTVEKSGKIGGNSSSISVLTKENGKFRMVETIRGSNSKQRSITTDLYVVGNSTKNLSGEYVYTGVAERKIQIDTFVRSNFVLIIPQVLENPARLSFENQEGEITEKLAFKCIRPDNR